MGAARPTRASNFDDLIRETLWIVSKEDFILSKLGWARQSQSERQRSDVENLLGTGLDMASTPSTKALIFSCGVALLMKPITQTCSLPLMPRIAYFSSNPARPKL
jgi:hypothetical protein